MRKFVIGVIALFVVFDAAVLFSAQAQDANQANQDLRQLEQLRQSTQRLQQQRSQAVLQRLQKEQAAQQKRLAAQKKKQSAKMKQMMAGQQRTDNTKEVNRVLPPATRAMEDAAFDAALKQKYPLSPEQIKMIKQRLHQTEFATDAPLGTPPRPTATSQFVNLAPGSTPPVVRLAKGFVSSLVFIDSTGAPWPIEAYDLGNPKAFNIVWDRKSNTLMIQALELYKYGNLAVRLRGLNTPVMITLIPGQKAVDYRQDLRIQGLGPNANQLTTGEGMPGGTDPVLLSVLDGVPPPGSKALKVHGGSAEVWLARGKLYLRTRLTLISPGWISSLSSADGTRAYELQRTPLLLVSSHGKLMQLKLEGL